jgi:hypothetical protein
MTGRDLSSRAAPPAVIVWHRFIETKRIEKPFLVSVVPAHHRPLLALITSTPVNHGSRTTSTDFCNKIGQEQTSLRLLGHRERWQHPLRGLGRAR